MTWIFPFKSEEQFQPPSLTDLVYNLADLVTNIRCIPEKKRGPRLPLMGLWEIYSGFPELKIDPNLASTWMGCISGGFGSMDRLAYYTL